MHPSEISAITVNHSTGEIVTCSASTIYLWTINGEMIAVHSLSTYGGFDTISSVALSKELESQVSDYLVITGHRDGTIRFWAMEYLSSKQLEKVNEISRLMLMNEKKEERILRSSISENFNNSRFIEQDFLTKISKICKTDISVEANALSRQMLSKMNNNGEKRKRRKSIEVASGTTNESMMMRPYMKLKMVEIRERSHKFPVTLIYTSATARDKLWTADAQGYVKQWNLVADHHWETDTSVKNCPVCNQSFNALERRHHCRNCGKIFCNTCTSHRVPLPKKGCDKPVRICMACFAEYEKQKNDYNNT